MRRGEQGREQPFCASRRDPPMHRRAESHSESERQRRRDKSDEEGEPQARPHSRQCEERPPGVEIWRHGADGRQNAESGHHRLPQAEQDRRDDPEKRQRHGEILQGGSRTDAHFV
ncbi:hypothetical protein [Rhizobium sp. G21]|uniref:hypothetical protein n=1 Tax=Rhizobium sp. G21 TaxID=2758439 RepID=UPI001600BFE2|nr:hypothetical protein [Rhizobium sp. G21]MBB1250533.1 hypothetical protein [Rhizobium sp. G21]